MHHCYYLFSVNTTGVTQELIDEVRASPELKMLEELNEFIGNGGKLSFLGSNGETLVIVTFSLSHFIITM